jgi:hypothetical protein
MNKERKMKIRKYFGILLCLFAFLMVGVARLSALPTSNEIVQNVSTERTALSEGVEFYARKDLTAFNGDIETVKRPQNVQAIVVPKSSEAVDLVVWSKGSNDKWSAAKLRDTIEDFELRNPGYTVIAGVNGDFFDISDTYQPTNSMVSAGDVWKKDTYRANNVTNTVFGFKPDKSYIVGPMTTDNYMTLKVMDGKVVTNSFKIDHANDKVLPTDNTQVSLFYPNLDLDVDFTGYTVYVGEL